MKPREERLSLDYLRSVLNYDPETGVLKWKAVASNRIKVGDIAGQIDHHGHRYINVGGTRYSAHRLAWFYTYGMWPKEEIDHINLEKSDNRLVNLREATVNENRRNVKMRSHNTTGFKGVTKSCTSRHLFIAQIVVNKRNIYLGIFKTAEEAHEAYVEASQRYHGTYGRST